ncbi:hypothetical protein RRG08_000358, partial [Elysia crispata]
KILALLVSTLLASALLPRTSSAPTTTSSPFEAIPTNHPGEPYCRNTVVGACEMCSPEAQPNCLARVIRFCDCIFNCVPDCDCNDNTPCAPLE